MQFWEQLGLVLGALSLALILSVAYFLFKTIGFFLAAVDLYKTMVRQQAAIVALLLDIRDDTKTYTPPASTQ